MKNGLTEKNRSLAIYRNKGSHSKILSGKTADKYPVILDGGRTVIFISDKSKEAETRERYELHRNPLPSGKPHS